MIDLFQTNGSSPPPPTTDTADFLVADHGSLYLLHPLTPSAVAWLDANVCADHLTFGDAVVVEPRYVLDIVTGILDDGLAVRP